MLVTIWMWTHEWSVRPRRCGVDAGHVPPRLDLQVGVDRLQQLIETPVAARRRADVDVGQRGVGGCHAPQTSEAPGRAPATSTTTASPCHETLSGAAAPGAMATVGAVAAPGVAAANISVPKPRSAMLAL